MCDMELLENFDVPAVESSTVNWTS